MSVDSQDTLLTNEERELVDLYRRMPTPSTQKHFLFVARHLYNSALAEQIPPWWLYRNNGNNSGSKGETK